MTVEDAVKQIGYTEEQSELPVSAEVEAPQAETSVSILALEQSMAQLISTISEQPVTPVIGVTASQAIMKCFEQCAADVERLAMAQVDHAQTIERDARHFAESIRRTGHKFCRTIEDETARGQQIALLMRKAQRLVEDSR